MTGLPDDDLKRRLLRPLSDEEQRQFRSDRLRDLFGEVIFSYTDTDATEDGILIPYMVNGRDTRHRITRNAYDGLKAHHGPRCPDYDDEQYQRFFLNELLTLAPEAIRVYKRNGILTTNLDFAVIKYQPGRANQLWYLPNEVGGVTQMLPSDY